MSIERYEIQLQLGAKVLFREAGISERPRAQVIADAAARAIAALIAESRLGSNMPFAGDDIFAVGNGLASKQGATFVISFAEARRL